MTTTAAGTLQRIHRLPRHERAQLAPLLWEYQRNPEASTRQRLQQALRRLRGLSDVEILTLLTDLPEGGAR
jgi:hypothetical protein